MSETRTIREIGRLYISAGTFQLLREDLGAKAVEDIIRKYMRAGRVVDGSRYVIELYESPTARREKRPFAKVVATMLDDTLAMFSEEDYDEMKERDFAVYEAVKEAMDGDKPSRLTLLSEEAP